MAAAGPHATSTVPARPRLRQATLLGWRFGPALLLMAVIWWLSAKSHLQTDLGWIDMVLRKGAHMTEFALLTLLWARALRWGVAPLQPLRWPRLRTVEAASPSVRGLLAPRAAIVAGAAIAFVWAIVDETHQHFVSGRVGSPRDVAIDAVGIAIAVVAWRAFLHTRTVHRARASARC